MTDYEKHPHWDEVVGLFCSKGTRTAQNNAEVVLSAWDAWPELMAPSIGKPFDADVYAIVLFVVEDSDTGNIIETIGSSSYNRPSYQALSQDLLPHLIDPKEVRRSPRCTDDFHDPCEEFEELESYFDPSDYAGHGEPVLSTMDEFYIRRPDGKEEQITLDQFFDCYLANLVATVIWGGSND